MGFKVGFVIIALSISQLPLEGMDLPRCLSNNIELESILPVSLCSAFREYSLGPPISL